MAQRGTGERIARRGFVVGKIAEHLRGALLLSDAPPHSLAAALGLLSAGWGFAIVFIPSTWQDAPFYAALNRIAPGVVFGLPMMASGVIQVLGATNGILLSRVAMVAIIVQACVWGVVSWSAIRSHPASTGTVTYSVLSLLSLLLYSQWRRAARREGKLPRV